MPTVRFLCGCSFNQDVLLDDTKYCPNSECEEDRVKIEEVLQRQAVEADNHEHVFKQLGAAKSKFGVITDCFGKNLFNNHHRCTSGGGGGADMGGVALSGRGRDIDLDPDLDGPRSSGVRGGYGGGGGGGGGY
jgi:hypothetical protein